MVSGVRTKDDALQLAGVDFLVAGPRVLEELGAMPTLAGYNDGLRPAGDDDGDDEPTLTPAYAAAAAFEPAETAAVTKQLFEDCLGLVGRDLLESGVARLAADVERAVPMMGSIVYGTD